MQGSNFRHTKRCEPPEGDLKYEQNFRVMGKGFREVGEEKRRSNPSRGKGVSPSLKVKCEVIIDQAGEGSCPARPHHLDTPPGHMPTVPVAHSLTRVLRGRVDGDLSLHPVWTVQVPPCQGGLCETHAPGVGQDYVQFSYHSNDYYPLCRYKYFCTGNH